MFSTAQLDLIKPLVTQMRDAGYLYYLCFTNSASGVTNDYDTYIYFSKGEITSADGYSFELPADSVQYSIRSGNASTNYRLSRFDMQLLSKAQIVTVDYWQHISTNCIFTTGYTLQPDLTFTEVRQNEATSGILFIACVFIFFYSFLKLFRR